MMDKKRKGLITASRAMEFMTNGRGKDKEFGETALTYAKELALARIGFEPEPLSTWQMEWGIEWEAEARNVYEQSRGEVNDPRFVMYNDYVGATPDGFIGDDGLLEIKCPQWKNHTDYLIGGPPKQYYYQMQFQLMVTDRQWCDFMTFHPHMPDHLKAKVFRIERDNELIEQFIERLPKFEMIINDYIKLLKN